MKTFLVINPHSANGLTGKRWPEIGAEVGKAIGEFGHAFTEAPLDATRLTRRALGEGYQCIVAVGGDGTVNEVTNGFFDGDRVINPGAALGLIPRGTGGDFRRAFGWDLQLPAAVARLRGEGTKPLDVGLLEYTAPDGSKARRYFANVCSFGVSGLVDKVVNQSSKMLGGKLSFMVGSVKALLQYQDRRVRVKVDGKEAEDVDITTVGVANGRFFGGGMMVAPEAATDDGLFDVTIWSGYGLKDFVFRSQGIYSGAHVKWKGTRTLRCQTLEADSDEEVLIDCDGEQPGRLPCLMKVLPGAIRLKV